MAKQAKKVAIENEDNINNSAITTPKKKKHKYLSLFSFMMGKYRGLYYLNFVFLFFGTLLSCFSTFISKLMLDILKYPTLGDFNSEVTDPFTNMICSWFGGFDYLKNNLWFFSVIIVLVAIAISCFSISRFLCSSYTSTGMNAKVQKDLFNHIIKLPYPTIKQLRNGDILQTSTKDLDKVRRFLVGDVRTVVYTLFILLIAFTFLCLVNWKIAVVSICLLPLLFVYSFFIIKPVRTRYRLTDDSEGLMTARIEENLSSCRIVKAYNNEQFEINQFETYLNDYKAKFISWRKLSSFFFGSSDIIVFSQILLSSCFGMYLCMTGEIGLSTVFAATTYVNMIVWPFRDVATTLSNLASVQASMDRISLLLDQPQEDLISGATPVIKGNIEFKDVSFKFTDADINTLSHINLKIKAGQTVAVLGKTGSGKSTLGYLLTRLYETSSGSIYIDGTPIKDIQKRYLRQNVQMILQEPFLFSRSIYSNINISNENISQEQIYNAAQIAHIDQNIKDFKEGYNTLIGEKGVTLSGGQKQRLSIARSLVVDAPILIMDDSLSAVDTKTDIEIRTALKQKMDNTTCLIITHRVSTAKDADMIVVLEDNTITQSGTYDELIKQDGLFKRIADIQTRMK